jgi:putative nucleotidyltransferase with HDIG domain
LKYTYNEIVGFSRDGVEMKERVQYTKLLREPCCLPEWIWYSLSFVVGASFLIIFSIAQKFIMGEIALILQLKAYIIPILYGGLTGLLIGRWYRRLRQKEDDLLYSYDVTISGWAKAVELRDEATQNHSLRVATLTEEIARKMGIPESQLISVRRGALLHDIGKIAVSDMILNKPAALTSAERALIQEHPACANEMLKDIDFLKPALSIPLYHHERWDGSGYPGGLKGEEIPLEARIFAVIDVWDALTSDRPYRAAWREEDALAYIEESAGTLFDPNVVRVFSAYLCS